MEEKGTEVEWKEDARGKARKKASAFEIVGPK